MSHFSKQTVQGFDKVHPAVLAEGIKVAAQLMALQGLQVTDFIYDWPGNKVTNHDGIQVIYGIDAQGSASSHKFAGMGLAVDKNGKLAIIGDFYYAEQKARRDLLQKQLEQVLGGSCYFAARAMIARAKGQKCSVTVAPETRQLQLTVAM